jgi:thiol:disulfide interchange protein DsbC
VNNKLLPFLLISVSLIACSSINTDKTVQSETKAQPSYREIPGSAPVNVKTNISNTLKNTKFTRIDTSVIPGLYEIVAGSNVIYSNESGEYLVFGHVFDVKNQKDLTQPVKNGLPGNNVKTSSVRLKWNELPLDAAVEYGNKNGKKIAVFSDPECPYCKKLHATLRGMKNIHVFEIMYPLQSIHPQSMKKAKAILCSKNPEKMLDVTFSGGVVALPKTGCTSDKLTKAIEYGKRVGIQGTPVMVNEEGKILVGAQAPEKILAWLKSKETNTASSK